MAYKVYGWERYRSCCIRHNFFTAGSNEQYAKVFDKLKEGISIHDLALVTWVCSSGYTLDEIKAILSKEMRVL